MRRGADFDSSFFTVSTPCSRLVMGPPTPNSRSVRLCILMFAVIFRMCWQVRVHFEASQGEGLVALAIYGNAPHREVLRTRLQLYMFLMFTETGSWALEQVLPSQPSCAANPRYISTLLERERLLAPLMDDACCAAVLHPLSLISVSPVPACCCSIKSSPRVKTGSLHFEDPFSARVCLVAMSCLAKRFENVWPSAFDEGRVTHSALL